MEYIKCQKCGKEIGDESKFCQYCGKKITTKQKNTRGKKLIILFVVVFIIAVIICCIAKEKIEYNSDLKECYTAIQENCNYDLYETIVNRHLADDNFKKDAEKQLYKAIDEKIQIIKSGNNEPFTQLNKLLQATRFKDDNMNRKYLLMSSYTRINTANTYLEEGDYYTAYQFLSDANKNFETLNDENNKVDEETQNNVISKLNEIRDKTVEQIIQKGQNCIEKGKYEDLQRILKTFEDLKSSSKEFEDFYNTSTEKINKHEEEEQAKEKAKKKSQGVTLGMTKQQVLDSSWGEPKDINTSIGSWGTHEQWVYGNGNYLYFENGRLTSIQN